MDTNVVLISLLFFLFAVGILAKSIKAKVERERHEETIKTIKESKNK